MIAIGLRISFMVVSCLLLIFHLPAIRTSRMNQIGRAISAAVESRSPFMDGMYGEITDLSGQLSL